MTDKLEVPLEKLQSSGENDPASVHDAMFYKAFSKAEHAAAELKCIFKPALVARIEWDTFKPLPIKFVDAKLTGRYADVLYSVRIGGRETLIYFLLEHKSDSDPWTPLQLLEYKTRIWRAYVEDPVNKGKLHLPVIIAVVLHHSERGWKRSRRFRGLFDVAEQDVALLEPYMLDFGMMVDDISKLSADAITRRPITPEGRLVLFALRFGRTPKKFLKELPKIVPVILTLRSQPHGRLVIASFIVYLKTAGKIPEEEVRVALQQAVGHSIAEEILFGAERRYEKGLREGQRKLLKQLLGQRFGMLPADVLARIDSAETEDLDAMGLRVLTAVSLEEALGASTQTPC